MHRGKTEDLFRLVLDMEIERDHGCSNDQAYVKSMEMLMSN